MSKAMDKKRASQFIFRNGQRISRCKWDKYQKELKEVAEDLRLKAIGLIKNK